MTISIIPIRLPDGTLQDAQLTYDEERDVCFLSLVLRETTLSAQASDYFEALSCIRIQLEQYHVQLLCYGASRSVYPSGMGRDMGQGLRAYKLTLGQYARTSDLVDIFASGSDVEPATVQEQRTFYAQWLASIKTG